MEGDFIIRQSGNAAHSRHIFDYNKQPASIFAFRLTPGERAIKMGTDGNQATEAVFNHDIHGAPATQPLARLF